MSTWHTRPFDESTLADFTAYAALRHAGRPEYSISGERLQEAARKRAAKLVHLAWVVEDTGQQMLGVGILTQYEDVYHPQKFYASITVHPDHRRHGIGWLLWETLEAELLTHDPIEVKGSFFEDTPGAEAFATKCGFVELSRRYKSTLNLANFDLDRYQSALDRLHEQGIRLKTFRELAADSDRDQKLYDLAWEVDSDVPFYEPIVRLSFESWKREYLENEDVRLDSSFVAVNGDQYIGFTHTMLGTGEDSWLVALTGTARAYRRRGISRALKVRATMDAKARGIRQLETYNDAINEGILAINQEMGFVHHSPIRTIIKR